MLTLPAPAKLNLFLHVVGRRADGYHRLQTVFQFLDFGDQLKFARRSDGLIRRVEALPGVAEADDLSLRAADTLDIAPTYINLGGGFGISYSADGEELDLARVADELAGLVARAAPARIVLELGRYFVAEAGWYLYAVGQDIPASPSSADKVRQFTSEIDVLLRREHHEDYCAIVYADNLDTPSFIKIYDPNHLGSSCGSSATKSSVLPGWIMSQVPPQELKVNGFVTGQRKRWWQTFLGLQT